MTAENTLLEVRNLRKYFPVRKGLLQRTVAQIKAVDGVDLTIRTGETLGLVGESGCGKTTTGRTILRLVEPTGGEILFRGRSLAGDTDTAMTDVATASPAQIKLLRRDMQIIFQDPYSSLDPRMTVGEIVGEPLQIQGLMSRSERMARVLDLLGAVGLSADHARRYPHEFSGGQRQRIGIARALALNPRLVVADEPVSALDVSVRAAVTQLLMEIQRTHGTTLILISHDLALVRYVADSVVVMYLGQVMEAGTTGQVFSAPHHPYTEALLAAQPRLDGNQEPVAPVEGETPSPLEPPVGCPFHTRCPRKLGPICEAIRPPEQVTADGHRMACHIPMAELARVQEKVPA